MESPRRATHRPPVARKTGTPKPAEPGTDNGGVAGPTPAGSPLPAGPAHRLHTYRENPRINNRLSWWYANGGQEKHQQQVDRDLAEGLPVDRGYCSGI